MNNTNINVRQPLYSFVTHNSVVQQLIHNVYFISTVSILSIVISIMFYNVQQKRMVLRVVKLYYYPIKSCRGIQIATARLNRLGIEYDRNWMIINPSTGKQRTARELRKMTTIIPSFNTLQDGTLQLILNGKYSTTSVSIPVIPPENSPSKDVNVWDNILKASVYSCDVNTWLTEYLDTPCELVTIDKGNVFSFERHLATDYTAANMNKQNNYSTSAFADGYPLLITTVASLRDLNKKIKADIGTNANDVLMEAFRPNIVVDAPSLRGWDEDNWEYITINGIEIHTPKPCGRCTIPLIHPYDGTRNKEGQPIRSLRKYRTNKSMDAVIFGQNGIHLSGGEIHVGDIVTIKRRLKPLIYHTKVDSDL
ncbi:unnamed protein product [Didymodactylos carnosus]|uniref:MOSC domain-containing protein n=1 Tax=Didymodactylos carnosus TaxID=1234261 RepID=A0A814RDZ1_9BILA|nr:unnamed protein product [Didymodactylos carnosus]CAF1132684.1 unnamed protein product [Didymodactylos carnosus]CAF3695801.1 unnamed protein product [Didymodactylos carnosus]CAF3896501.1 unnamed protein product [Didymodactylos carnosus]